MSEPTLSAEGVAVQVGGRRVLESVGLNVAAGEFVGLVGPNGAGKTTFLRAVAGLVPLASGSIRVEGASLAELGAAGIARRVAYLPFGAPCHWAMTAERVVSLGRLPFQPAWQGLSAADWSIIDDAMQRAEVDAFARRSIDRLSAGERARVMVARALAQQPRLLLADEPTATLDPYHQLRVLEALRGIATGGGAVLAVFHDLSLAARFCSRLVLMKDGKVSAEGPPDAVLTPDNVLATYGVEMGPDRAATYTLPHS